MDQRSVIFKGNGEALLVNTTENSSWKQLGSLQDVHTVTHTESFPETEVTSARLLA